jgi:predicted acyltransferase
MATPIVPNQLSAERVRSIDAFRGLTFVAMIFVNELHGVGGMPVWMKHMPADADAMSVPDVVFPAFLFIVGMSIPFALQARLARGATASQWLGHTVSRALALVVMGLFMVNAESGFDERAMPLPIAAWSLLFYAAMLLAWGTWPVGDRALRPLRGVGVLLMLWLAAVYRGGSDGREAMTPQWWGILGLIGWAYLAASVLYVLARGRIDRLLLMIAGCVAYYAVSHLQIAPGNPVERWLLSFDGHASHTSIVLCGLVTALLFFDGTAATSASAPQGDLGRRDEPARRAPPSRRYAAAALLAAALLAAGTALRPAFTISKIYATPAWCFYSAAICIAIFALLHACIDRAAHASDAAAPRWTRWVAPAAESPLMTYLIPFIVEALMTLFGWQWPEALRNGLPGLLRSLAYAGVVVALVAQLNRLQLRLRI